MKNKFLSIVFSLTLAMGFCGVATAKETHSADEVINNNIVEQLYYDENGNMVAIVRDDLTPTMQDISSVQRSEVSRDTNPLLKEAGITINLTSTLSPVSTEELWATNTASTPIEYMWVQCYGYYPSGASIDHVVEESEPGYTYLIMTAKVKVPASPNSSLRVASGMSDHVYKDPRFEYVNHHLTWNIYN